MSYVVLFIIILFDAILTLMAPLAGFTVQGELVFATINQTQPGIFGALEWLWDSMQFIFYLSTFQIDNIPTWVTMIFIVSQVMMWYLIIKLIRGGE